MNDFNPSLKLAGYRTSAKHSDLSEGLTNEQEQRVKEAAEVSMGTDISATDLDCMQELCEQVCRIFSTYLFQ